MSSSSPRPSSAASSASDAALLEANQFAQCKYIHEVELMNMRLQMRILETHLETKDRLLRNLEDIIDEQETRIASMEDFIQGRAPRYVPRTVTLRGISVLSLDFGVLSEENLRLKELVGAWQRRERTAQLLETDEDYESDLTSVSGEESSMTAAARFSSGGRATPCAASIAAVPSVSVAAAPEVARVVQHRARAFIDEHQLSRLKRCCDELKREKDELRKLSLDTRDAFTVCMAEVRCLLESKTSDFFKVLIERYKAEMERRRLLHNQLVELNGNIRVFYRIRPPLGGGASSSLRVDAMDEGVVHLEHSAGRKTSRAADFVIPIGFTQAEIFSRVSPIVTSCVDGYNVCIFAYGHTGSGKTHTMEGPLDDPGINQRAILQLFCTADERADDIHYKITVSMIEIYNEKIRDLLNSSTLAANAPSLTIRKDDTGALSVPGLQARHVCSPEDVAAVLKEGRNNRVVASTEANANSSRSHVIVRVHVHARNSVTGTTTIGRLNLVDLAGSERVSQTNATGQLLREAQAINKSLSELGNVVFALRQNQKHIPFRNCQLTRLLEDSLHGDSKTLVLVHLAPEEAHVCESVSSINFAEKIGQVQTGGASARLKRGDSIRRSNRKPLCGSPNDSPRKGATGGAT